MKIKVKDKGAITGSRAMVSFPRLHRPVFADSLKFPADITELTAQNVAELIGKYSSMLAYAVQEGALAQMRLLITESALTRRETEVFQEKPALGQVERWRRDMVLASDIEVSNLQSKKSVHRQTKELADGYARIYEAFIAALSRELTRKTASQDGLRYQR